MPKNTTNSATPGIASTRSIAGAGARSYAFVIDWHIRLLLALCWLIVTHFAIVGALTLAISEQDHIRDYLYLAVAPAAGIYFLYHPILEILMQGRTPGKRIAGVRVVTLDGESPALLVHLIRNLFRLVDSLPACYVVGLVTTTLTKKSVRLGDIVAGTVLVYETEDRGAPRRLAPLNPESIKQYGLARIELGQDLLDRWNALEEKKRIKMAAKFLANLEPPVQPAEDSNSLRQQLHQVVRSGQILNPEY